MQRPLSLMSLLLWVCACMCDVWVRCQHFVLNRSTNSLSPHLKDIARRGKTHLCHSWHFNLSLLAILFPSIAHQCIRANGPGHRGISGFNTIDTHPWLRLQKCGCKTEPALSDSENKNMRRQQIIKFKPSVDQFTRYYFNKFKRTFKKVYVVFML